MVYLYTIGNAITHRDYSIKGTDIQIKMFDDRIVVESPGKLPGLVKPENIRYTHFSRNPKIAEFLRSYKFVKEYGEGVNRMFDEMSRCGLPEPVFYRNNFMLQTIIKNNSSQKEAVHVEKVTFEDEKVMFEDEKVTFDVLNARLIEANITKIMRGNIINLYQNIAENQVFGRKEIVAINKCSDTNAGMIISAMREARVITATKGKGKGKYVFCHDTKK